MQPLTMATYEGTINRTGLSFINDVKQSKLPRVFIEDVEKNAYMLYILGLIDAAYVDNQPIAHWFDEAKLAEAKMVAGFDAQALANYLSYTYYLILGFKSNGKVVSFVAMLRDRWIFRTPTRRFMSKTLGTR
ncbi:Uncharacterised protein [Weissella viridescens]|uniref:Uncharacterized protein n=1 Tax=Weissella viridescens TaxID=1629 RepID=A0A380P7X8_WEIVI|nr:Uncharacterised protein [Weissella viridescens]